MSSAVRLQITLSQKLRYGYPWIRNDLPKFKQNDTYLIRISSCGNRLKALEGVHKRAHSISELSFIRQNATLPSSPAATTATLKARASFPAHVVAWVPDMSSSISSFVSMKVVECLLATPRERSNVTMMRIKAVVDMTEEAMRTVKPRACSDEQAADEPIRAVIAIGRAVIRRIVKIPIRTYRSDPYVDGNLSGSHRCGAGQGNGEDEK